MSIIKINCPHIWLRQGLRCATRTTRWKYRQPTHGWKKLAVPLLVDTAHTSLLIRNCFRGTKLEILSGEALVAVFENWLLAIGCWLLVPKEAAWHWVGLGWPKGHPRAGWS